MPGHLTRHVYFSYPPLDGGLMMQNEIKLLQLTDIFRSRTFRAGDNIETYPITLGQRFETLGLDR